MHYRRTSLVILTGVQLNDLGQRDLILTSEFNLGFVLISDSERHSTRRRVDDGLLRQHLQRRDAHLEGPLQDGRTRGSRESGEAEE